MLLQRCIILLSIFICYALSASERSVNCRCTPLHRACRGSQTKRGMDVEDLPFRNLGPMFTRVRVPANNAEYDYKKSKIWTAMLDQGLNTDALYDAYASASDRYNNGNGRRKHQDVLSDLDMLDY